MLNFEVLPDVFNVYEMCTYVISCLQNKINLIFV